MGFKPSIHILLAVFCATFTTLTHAAWNLDPSKSSLNFTSIKNESIAEVHSFTEIAGTLSQTGEFMIDIVLTSVDTGIEIRDQRMQEDFFEVMEFPLAMATGRVDASVLAGLEEKRVTDVTVDLVITLHGMKVPVSAKLKAVKLSPTTLWVSSDVPVIINTADFKLSEGVDKLKKLAGLPSIAYAVPVAVNLFFEYTETAPEAP